MAQGRGGPRQDTFPYIVPDGVVPDYFPSSPLAL